MSRRVVLRVLATLVMLALIASFVYYTMVLVQLFQTHEPGVTPIQGTWQEDVGVQASTD